MDNNEIKKANRKAMPKFILIMVISVIIGGGIGFFSAKYGIDALAGSMKTAGELFGMHIAPWLMLAIAIIIPVISVQLYNRAKRMLTIYDGEDEVVTDNVEGKLSIVIWLTGAALIISYFLIAASYSGGFATFDNEENTILYFISIAAFFIILIETVSVSYTHLTLPTRSAV